MILIILYVRKKNKETQFGELLKAIDDKSTATGSSEDLKSNRAFDPFYYKSKKAPTLNVDYTKLATQVYDAKGVVKDDEDSVLAVYGQFRSKLHASYLANIFQQRYKRNLYDYLQSFMDQKYMDQLLDRVKQLAD